MTSLRTREQLPMAERNKSGVRPRRRSRRGWHRAGGGSPVGGPLGPGGSGQQSGGGRRTVSTADGGGTVGIMFSLPRRRNAPVMEPPPFRVLSPYSPEMPPPPRTPDPTRIYPPQVQARRMPTSSFVILADEPTTPYRSSSPFRGRGFKDSRIPVAKGPLAGARSAPQSRHQSPSKIPRPRGSTPSPTPYKDGNSNKRVNARPPRPDVNGSLGRKSKVPTLDPVRSRSTSSLNSVRISDAKYDNSVRQKNLKNAGFKKEKEQNQRFVVDKSGRNVTRTFDKKLKIDAVNRFFKEGGTPKSRIGSAASRAGTIKIEVAGKPEDNALLEEYLDEEELLEQEIDPATGEGGESTVTIIQIDNEPASRGRMMLSNLVAARSARRVATGLSAMQRKQAARKAAVPPVPKARESVPKAVSPEVQVITDGAGTSSPETLNTEDNTEADMETANGDIKMNGLRVDSVTELLTTDLDALEEGAVDSLGVLEADVTGTVSEPPEVDNQSANQPRSRVSFL